MEEENKSFFKKRELLSWVERLQVARGVFIDKYEKLLKDPEYQPVDQEEINNLEILKLGGKIKSYRIAIDAAAGVCKDKLVSAFTLRDVSKVYDELFTDWRSSAFVNYDEDEWNK